MTEQLQEQQQAAAERAAGLEAEVSQLQQQLQSAQTEAEETHAAAKLRQIEHEDHMQALAQVLPPLLLPLPLLLLLSLLLLLPLLLLHRAAFRFVTMLRLKFTYIRAVVKRGSIQTYQLFPSVSHAPFTCLMHIDRSIAGGVSVASPGFEVPEQTRPCLSVCRS